MLFQRREAFVEAIRLLRRIGTRSPQYRSATRQNTGHRAKIEGHCHIFQQAAPAFKKSHELVAVMKAALANHRPDHCVQARAIPAAGQYADFHCVSLYEFRISPTRKPKKALQIVPTGLLWKPQDYHSPGTGES